MRTTTVTATDFKAKCLALIDDMNRTRVPVIVTRHGKPVAELRPAGEGGEPVPFIGSMTGSVLQYDDPFSPAIDPEEWDSAR